MREPSRGYVALIRILLVLLSFTVVNAATAQNKARSRKDRTIVCSINNEYYRSIFGLTFNVTFEGKEAMLSMNKWFGIGTWEKDKTRYWFSFQNAHEMILDRGSGGGRLSVKLVEDQRWVDVGVSCPARALP